MRAIIVSAILVLSMMSFVPLAASNHGSSDCVPEQRDAIAVGDLYIDDRPGEGFPEGTGFVTGDGTWIYQESNTVEGLQAGGGSNPPSPVDEFLISQDPITSENCGHGPDTLIF